MHARLLFFGGALIVATSGAAEELPDYVRAPRAARVSAAYKARMLCSAVFVAGREPEAVERAELRRYPQAATVDRARSTVSVKAGFGLPDATAIYRPGLGCTAAIDYTLEHIQRQPVPDLTPAGPPPEAGLPWPEGEAVSADDFGAEVDRKELEAAVATAFAEPDRDRHRGTRAVVVVYKGRILAERYAEGFSKDTPLMGWSMTKSLVNALVGILVGEGRLSIESKGLQEEWRGKNDPRHAITLENLLTMTSGQEFVEDYGDMLADTPFMLSGTPDVARFAAEKPLRDRPGKVWRYISGSPNIVCRILRGAIGGTLADYWAFPRRSLFDRIGMRSAVLEPDATGTFVGSALAYATARDWARFGLLYLRDGVWGDERILPAGWVKYSTTPTPASRGEYGAYFWLNVGRGKGKSMFPSLPRDLFMALGYGGQNVIVIPSADLVIVHLGSSEPPTEGWDPEPFVSGVISSLRR
jgi:CubicO group peptidase (beta-lactamase class C family)